MHTVVQILELVTGAFFPLSLFHKILLFFFLREAPRKDATISKEKSFFVTLRSMSVFFHNESVIRPCTTTTFEDISQHVFTDFTITANVQQTLFIGDICVFL